MVIPFHSSGYNDILLIQHLCNDEAGWFVEIQAILKANPYAKYMHM